MTAQLSEPDDLLVQRVRKLLDKAERTDNGHEAEVFAAKAAELVAQHRIEPDRLATARDGEELAIAEVHVGRGAYVRARLALLQGIAEAHDVRVVFQATATGTVAFLAGYRSDLAVTEVMYHSLHQQAASQVAAIKKQTGAATQRYRRSFLFGFAGRIAELLAESRSSVESEAADGLVDGDASSTEVALRARAERVDEFAARSWGRVRSASPPSAVSSDGYARGTAAAGRADVGRARLRGRRSIGRGDG